MNKYLVWTASSDTPVEVEADLGIALPSGDLAFSDRIDGSDLFQPFVIFARGEWWVMRRQVEAEAGDA